MDFVIFPSDVHVKHPILFDTSINVLQFNCGTCVEYNAASYNNAAHGVSHNDVDEIQY